MNDREILAVPCPDGNILIKMGNLGPYPLSRHEAAKLAKALSDALAAETVTQPVSSKA